MPSSTSSNSKEKKQSSKSSGGSIKVPTERNSVSSVENEEDEIEEESNREEKELVFNGSDQSQVANGSKVEVSAKKASNTLNSRDDGKSLLVDPSHSNKRRFPNLADDSTPFVPNLETSSMQTRFITNMTDSSNLSQSKQNSSNPSAQTKEALMGYKRFCGLANLGHTCFANAVIQMLYTWPEFRVYLRTTVANGKNKHMHNSLSKLLEQMEKAAEGNQQSPCAAVKPKQFLDDFRKNRPEFRERQQQDAQEFLCVLLEMLHQETNSAVKLSAKELESKPAPTSAEQAWNFHVNHMDNSFLANCFVSQIQSTLTCLICGHQSLSWSCEWQVQLSLEDKPVGVSSKKSNVDNQNSLAFSDCLANHFADETLKDDNLPNCAHCGKRQPAVKKLSICRVPPYLLFHLKRFNQDGSKNAKPVNIESQILFGGRSYTLQFCLMHDGEANKGHYGALYREASNAWVGFEDETVHLDQFTDGNIQHMLSTYGYLALFKGN